MMTHFSMDPPSKVRAAIEFLTLSTVKRRGDSAVSEKEKAANEAAYNCLIYYFSGEQDYSDIPESSS